MNVLSLFDGMACGRIALERGNFKVDNYFASEIDKYAIQIANKNFPDIVQLGDATKWREWDLPKIDLLIGGSPCQGFSISGKRLNFDDPRSKLFFTFVDVLKHYKPKYFLLENVKMKKEWRDIISEHLGVEPILINSALVSAQNRERYYWTNIPNVGLPEDRGIILKNIIESGIVDRDKSYCVDANYFRGGNLKTYFDYGKRQKVFEEPKFQSQRRLQVKETMNSCFQVGMAEEINGHDIIKRVYSTQGKSPTVTSHTGGNQEPKISEDLLTWRKLTPLECERLQTVEDNYTDGVSNTQRYKMLGNGWTIDVIAHIFSFMPEK